MATSYNTRPHNPTTPHCATHMQITFQHVATRAHFNQVTLFGRTADGRSVAAHALADLRLILRWSASPVGIPMGIPMGIPIGNPKQLLRSAEVALESVRIVELQGQDITQFDETGPQTFYQLLFDHTRDYYRVRRLVRDPESHVHRDVHLFNNQLNLGAQYMQDQGICSCDVVTVQYNVNFCDTTCDLEVRIDNIAAATGFEAQFKRLSYDIECNLRPGVFPTSDIDPIITIGVATNTARHVFCLQETPDIDDIVVHSCHTEAQLLQEFNQFVVQYDPDFIMGHNINRFDNVYVRDRCEKCNVDFTWSRVRNYLCSIRKIVTQSNQKGTQEVFRLDCPGRVVVDSYEIFRAQHNLRSYKLDALGEHFLQQRKFDLPYDQIPVKFTTPEGRAELAKYCVQDSVLVLELIRTQCKIINTIQMSNVCGVDCNDILNRGQGIRTITLMLKYSRDNVPRLFIPQGTHNEGGFQGAVVLPPIRGIYQDAVVCVDFASLYPSIMRAMNMSYETLVQNHTIQAQQWHEGTHVRTVPDYTMGTGGTGGRLSIDHNPNNCSFVTTQVREGLLPRILRSVLDERTNVKKQMRAVEHGGRMHSVLNGKQLALKVVANSIYGFTGAAKGYLPEPRIASSVTKYGRGLTLRTMDMVDHHPDWQGSNVIYGDTDSCFIRLSRDICDAPTNKELVTKAHEVGTMMANEITKQFLPPILMEYESAFEPPFLLLKKKRYCGKLCLPGRPPKTYLKGVECVRRDFAPIVVTTQRAVIELLLNNEFQAAHDLIEDTFRKLYAGQIPIKDLTLCKKLSQLPEMYKTKAPHVELAKRLQREQPEVAPVAGDRIPYLIRAGADDLNQRAIAPHEIDQYTLDYAYYGEKQLRKPLERIMELGFDTANMFPHRPITAPKGNNGIMKWVTQQTRTAQTRTAPQPQPRKRRKHNPADIRTFFGVN